MSYWLATGLLLLAVVCGVLSVAGGFTKSQSLLLNVVGIVMPMVIGASACIAVALLNRSAAALSRLAWILIGAGMALCACGDASLFHHEMTVGGDPEVGTAIDALFWCSYLFQVVGIMILTAEVTGKRRYQHLIDSFTMCAAGGALLYTFIVGPVLSQTDLSTTERIFGVGYPVLTFLVAWAGLAFLAGSASTGHIQRSIAYLGIGSVITGLTDNVWTAQSLTQSYQSGSWVDYGWIVGYSFQALGAMSSLLFVVQGVATAQTNNVLIKRLGIILPYLATTLSIVFLTTYEILGHGTLSAGSVITIVLIVAILGFRQVLTLLEKQSEISSFAETLEQTVIKRTQQLEARYQLAKAVNSTPDIEQFAESAATHTMNVFECDGLIITISPGILKNHPRGLAVNRGFAEEAGELLGDKIYQPDPLVSTEPLRMLIGDEWRIVSVLRVPLRAMNEIYGNLIAFRIEENFDFETRAAFESIALEMAAALGHNIMYTKAVEASERDYLTEMLNHRAISRRLQDMVLQAEEGDHVGVMIVDVGGFKLFNDTYGHAAGDDVLRCVSGRLFELAQPLGGRIGRTGGDEFMILVPHHSISETYRMAAKVQRAISDIDFRITGYHEKLPVEVNIGVASYPESGENPYTILAAADSNLIEAKRNRVTFLRDDGAAPITAENRNTSMEAVEMMLTAIDNVDSYTRRHSLDVMKYATWLAEELGSSHGTLEQVTTAALLHDVGKIAVPTSVLRKPGALTDEEFELMKRHTTIGALIVQAMPNMLDIVDGVKCHHERYDGRGYPDGLAGENIPFLGRLLAVADAFSAMTTNRPYRKGMDWPEAARRIAEGAGTQFDPRLATAFLRVLESRGVPVVEPAAEDMAA